jgi:hypothetical protein
VKVQGLNVQNPADIVAKSTEAMKELQQKMVDTKLDMDKKMVKVNVVNNLTKGKKIDVSV